MANRMLYSAGDGDIKLISDNEELQIIHTLQSLYANQLNNNGSGRVFTATTDQGRGGFANTTRTQQSGNGGNPPGQGSGSGAFPGTGTTTVNTYYVGQNTATSTVGGHHTLEHIDNTGDIREMGTSAHTRLFNRVKANIVAGGLGAYRFQINSPGADWTLRQSNAYIDTTYNGGNRVNYNLYLRISETAPGGVTPTPLYHATGGDLQIQPTTYITDHLFPLFSNWARTNIVYRLGGTQGTALNTLTDRRLNGTSNTQSGDTYTSTPSGAAVTHATTTFRVV